MLKIATIGFFDGVHRGHRFLINQIIDLSEKRGATSTVITFSNSPRSVVDTSYTPKYLTTSKEKERLLYGLGIDNIIIKTFTPEMMNLTAYQFMEQILKQELNIDILVIGYDHRFGHNRSEGFDDYVRYGEKIGIEVVKAEAYKENNTPISSSIIRDALSRGDVKMANESLGYDYSIEGTVINGFKIGRTIGFPTANISIVVNKMLPKDGAYVVRVHVNNNIFTGMLNIGHRPTFDNGERSIEVHILDFKDSIYDKQITIDFIAKIRDEEKFQSVEELTQQLKKDEEFARNYILKK